MRFFFFLNYISALLLCTVEGHLEETGQHSKAEGSVSHANYRNPSWSPQERFLGLWNVFRESIRTLVIPRRWVLPRSDIILREHLAKSGDKCVTAGKLGEGLAGKHPSPCTERAPLQRLAMPRPPKSHVPALF